MEREGLVEVERTEHTGHRARVVYTITEAGREELARLLKEGWQQPPRAFPSHFYTLLTFSEHLPPEQVRAGLEDMIAALERELVAWTEGEAIKARYIPMTEWIRAIFANGREHIEADLGMLQRLLAAVSQQATLDD